MRIFITVICLVALIIASAETGKKNRQEEIEKRALMLKEKDYYNWQDIEIIIFGEIQQ